jgi:Protein of unknown function (DUF3016)
VNTLRNFLSTGLLVVAGAVSSAASAATVSVTFVQPEKFADAGFSRGWATERDLAELKDEMQRHLQRLADRKLAATDTLQVEVLDIDLAGDFEINRFTRFSDVRVIRDIASPRLTLRYTLKQGDRVVTGAEERLSDMNFLWGHNRYSGGDRLRYEKPMLDKWFEKRFATP